MTQPDDYPKTTVDEETDLMRAAGRSLSSRLPIYTPPTVTTFTDAELLASLGPARAGSGMSMFGMD
ncbi:MAG: hypothetical protein HC802_05770 [Caldilineaceae bacterium]|nr:hypothetical protein [Caldilineaceae bacterium]